MPLIITESVTSLSVRIRATGQRVHASLVMAFTRIAIGLQQYIVTQKLEGQVLHHRSGKLIRSIQQHIEDSGNTIAAVVQAGSLAPYAAVHEWGGMFNIPEHQSFSRAGRAFSVRAHTATFPERSFMRSSLREYKDTALREIRAALNNAA